MSWWFLTPIVIPIGLGTICFIIPERIKFLKEFFAFLGSGITLILTIFLFMQRTLEYKTGGLILLRIDPLSSFVLLASGIFGFLIVLFSFRFFAYNKHQRHFYSSLLWTMGAACGALMSNHLILLVLFWGFLGITLYLLVLTGGAKAANAAKKTLIIIGGSDALLLLGTLLIYSLTSTFQMNQITVPFQGELAVIAFLCLILAAFAKAGAMPLHSWIPDVAENAPIPVTAYLPAALDKLLGIYLLARICLDMFRMTPAANLFLMVVGAATIIAAVMMALIQDDFRRLLAYCAISQVGYIVLGFGTGNPIGIAGGLFHMLNHSIYKACLFLSGGAVQYRTGETHLSRMGGLGKVMPITFTTFLVAGFAVSGIPPLNGFVSKWMVYQGLIELGKAGNTLWVLWLAVAMFGSGLTLASIMKLIHGIFLGVPSKAIQSKKIKEVGLSMLIPVSILAILCIGFGIFARSIPLKLFIFPTIQNVSFLGIWSPGLATILILVGLMAGGIIYIIGNWKGFREAENFIGGETIIPEERITGIDFYETIRKSRLLHKMYDWAEAKWFDIYDQLGKLALTVASLMRRIHTGVFTQYMTWVLAGLVILLVIWMYL